MKNIKKEIIGIVLMAAFIFASVMIINYRIEQTQKNIVAETTISENR